MERRKKGVGNEGTPEERGVFKQTRGEGRKERSKDKDKEKEREIKTSGVVRGEGRKVGGAPPLLHFQG